MKLTIVFYFVELGAAVEYILKYTAERLNTPLHCSGDSAAALHPTCLHKGTDETYI